MTDAIRILHCPQNVGGNPANLARVERTLGLDSWAVTFYQHYMAYPIDEVLSRAKPGKIHKVLLQFKLLYRAVFQFDIIHYNFGSTIFAQITKPENPTGFQWITYGIAVLYNALIADLDIRILRLLGKKIFVTFQGSDGRINDYFLTRFEEDTANEIKTQYTDAHNTKAHHYTKIFGKYAHHIYYLNPDLARALPNRAKFMPYAHLDLNDWNPVVSHSNHIPLVAHAPTSRTLKGTRFIIEAVAQLHQEGIGFEFVLVENMSHQQARKVYERADLLVDQLVIGWYGGLGLELMALGKPVIAYIHEDDLRFVPDTMAEALPIIQAAPDTIYDVLKSYLTEQKSELAEIGAKSRKFVETWHDAKTIAMKLKLDYESCIET